MTVSARATPGRNVAMSARAAPPANTLKRFLVSMLPPRRGWGWRKHAFGVFGGAITFGKFREYGRVSRLSEPAPPAEVTPPREKPDPRSPIRGFDGPVRVGGAPLAVPDHFVEHPVRGDHGKHRRGPRKGALQFEGVDQLLSVEDRRTGDAVLVGRHFPGVQGEPEPDLFRRRVNGVVGKEFVGESSDEQVDEKSLRDVRGSEDEYTVPQISVPAGDPRNPGGGEG